MTGTLPELRATIEIYLRAWMTQDADLIVTIFTPGATYHERVLDAPIRGVDWHTPLLGDESHCGAV